MSPEAKRSLKQFAIEALKYTVPILTAVVGFMYAAGAKDQKVEQINTKVTTIETSSIPDLIKEDKALREEIGKCKEKASEIGGQQALILESLKRIERKIDKHMEK